MQENNCHSLGPPHAKCQSVLYQCDQMIGINCPIRLISSQICCQAKNTKCCTSKLNFYVENIYFKLLLKPKKYLQQTMFETCYSDDDNAKNYFSKKLPKMLPFWGYLIFSRNPNILNKHKGVKTDRQEDRQTLG